MRPSLPCHRSLSVLAAFAFALSAAAPGLRAADALPATETAAEADDVMGDVTHLPAFDASANRMEDFGFRVSPAYDAARSSLLNRVYTPVVDVVLPNTAASRAGLAPGDRIVGSDGQPSASGSFSIKKWRRIQEAKWEAVAAGEKDVVWTLEVEAPAPKKLRTLRLRIPSPAPKWGGAVWQSPDRPPAIVPEPGPLADRARTVLDNGIWILLRYSYVRGLELPIDEAHPYFLCHQWTLWSGPVGHRIYVSRARGRTDIILEAISAETGAELSKTAVAAAQVKTLASATTVFARESRAYLTSPSGALEKAWMLPRGGPQREIPLEDARAEFQREIDFWLNKVGTTSPRWPLAVIAPEAPEAAVAASASADTPTGDDATGAAVPDASENPRERAAAFLKLPRASAAQRALFAEAFAKIGAEEDRWAYTETSRRLGEKRGVVTRVDPSKPEAERRTLVRVGGKPPSAEDVRRWREEGRDIGDALGELRAIREIVDRTDVRVFADEAAAVVFEVSMSAGAAGLPAEKLQALFRVNKTTRALEDIAVKMRESLRLSGVAKVTEAGLEARFGTLDPAYPPQPVRLRGGGAARVLLVKISRDFETTRTDFRRVEPYAGAP